MSLRFASGLALAALSALSLAACGGSDTSSTVDASIGSDGRPVAGRMLPMAVGDS
ncbi:MAG: hypothetical protein JNK64_37345 [Myxococcales bacterium]|nr:hypothetical protein [Myxococcales bacterium]